MTELSYDIAVIGAGPHALTVCAALRARGDRSTSMTVIDPSGEWMSRWSDAFARLEIATLRSPGVHHPDPDPHAFDSWRSAKGRNATGLPYGTPDAAEFQEFCVTVIDRYDLAGVVRKAEVKLLCATDANHHLLLLHDARLIAAQHVVLATNPHRRLIPTWAGALHASGAPVAHSNDLDLRGLQVTGEHIVIVGGGLTAGHLVCGAVSRGARVTLLARRPLRQRHFDVEPGWLGPRCLDGFRNLDDAATRRVAIDKARDGGTLPPWMHRRLTAMLASGWVHVVAPIRVLDALWKPGEAVELLLSDGSHLQADRVWLATGTRCSVDAEPLLDDVRRVAPTEIVDGLPVLCEDLRWPGTGIHLTGRLAALALGPAAGNLWGARQAAQRIVATR